MCSNNNYEFGLFEDSDNHIEPLENNLTVEDIDSILSLIDNIDTGSKDHRDDEQNHAKRNVSTWSSWKDSSTILENTRDSQHGSWEMLHQNWNGQNHYMLAPPGDIQVIENRIVTGNGLLNAEQNGSFDNVEIIKSFKTVEHDNPTLSGPKLRGSCSKMDSCLDEVLSKEISVCSNKQFILEKDLKHLKEVDGQMLSCRVYKSCQVCQAPGMKYASYGGQVCSSCRSFFRRSAQTGYHSVYECKGERKCLMDMKNRRSCQYCRFQSCLSIGMKITWVLSDQERGRRFNKLKKVNGQIGQSFKQTICSVFSISLSIEESKIIEDLYVKFKVPWLEEMLVNDRESGINFIRSVFGDDSLKYETVETYRRYICNNVIRFILPRLTQESDLCSPDI